MNILVFGLKSETLGGIESFVLNMNQYMQKDDISFDYAFLNKEACVHVSRIEGMGGRVVYLPYFGYEPFKYLKELFKLLKHGEGKYDALYVNLFSMVHITPVLLGIFLGYKVILHTHNNNIQHQSKIYRLLNWAGKQICKHINCLRLSNSDASTAFMFGSSKLKDTQVIYNAIDVDKYRFNKEARGRMRKELGIENKYVVGFSGRLALQKNPLFVLDIFNVFHKQNPGSVLLMAGDGPLLDSLITKINQNPSTQDSIILLGQRRDMEDVYQAMDVFLLPSLFEGLGIVLVEAQAAGLPCLTSKDVIPSMVDVTELIHRESLSSPADVWAERLDDMRLKAIEERDFYSSEVEKSMFNINTEAVRFGNIIKEYVG